MPLRYNRKLRLVGPIIAGNQSSLKGHRPTASAQYSTTRLSPLDSIVKKFGHNKSPPADNLPHDSQQGMHGLPKIGRILDGEHGKSKKSQAVSLEAKVLAQLSEHRTRPANFGGYEESREAFREHGSRMSLPWHRNSQEGLQEDPEKPQHDLLSQLQQSPSAQIATVHLPIQPGLLSTINSDARKTLEYANRDMLWLEGLARKDQLHPRKSHLDNPKYLARRTTKLLQFKHRADTCDEPSYQAFKREKLKSPVRGLTKQILGVINSNTYSIICGGYKSGENTHVPQLILDDAINNSTGASCRILCVQPKASWAITLSRQVANERLEKPGDTTGYCVQPDHTLPTSGGTITYCSRDILLNLLKNGASTLKQFSHIILDRVQLLDSNINVGMILLKRFVEQRKSIGASVPKVILMGEIRRVDDFCSYFGTKTTDGTLVPAPHVTISKAFPVEKHYLEEIIGNIAYSLAPNTLGHLLHNDDNTKEFLDNHFKLFGESDPIEKLKTPPTAEINRLGKEVVPCGLVSATLLSLLSTTKTGSILVYLPGIEHFKTVIRQVTAFGPKLGFDFADKDQFRIIQMPGNMAKKEAKSDLKPTPGCRRLIFSSWASNITIPDVRYVVDSGKSKHEDHELKDLGKTRKRALTWNDQTVASRRADRAGGFQAGHYYFLGAKKCFDSLPITSSPSTGAAHSDLRQACLYAKQVTSGTSLSITELFAQTYEPPQESNVRAAVDDLKELQALDEQEEPTALGHVLVDLDMDPCLGKMVVLGVIFQCLDPMLILASLGWNPRRVLKRPSSDRSYASVEGSDVRFFEKQTTGYHTSTIETFQNIREMLHKKGEFPAFKSKYSKAYMSEVYYTATLEIERIVKRLIGARIISPESLNSDEGSGFSCSSLNANSNHEFLIKSLLPHCLSSNLAVRSHGDPTLKFKSGEVIRKYSRDYNDKSYIGAYNFRSVSASMPDGMKQRSQVDPLGVCLSANKVEQEEDGVLLDSWLKIKLQTVESTEKEVSKNLIQTHTVLNEVSIFP
ncbi:unnamed protein product [Penicillium glandicola]